MSLSKCLQSVEILTDIKGKSFSYIEELLTEKGMQWFSENPDEEKLISDNLEALGLEFTPELVQEIKRHIILHYVEKILALSGTPEEFSQVIDSHVDYSEAKELIEKASEKGGVLIATPHFGGVELVVPTIARMGKLPNAVMRFSTPELSEKAQGFADMMASTGHFSQIKFIEIGKPGVSSAMEMAAALRRKEVLFTVFDEETEHSSVVELFGKKVLGGAGLDKLLRFTGEDVSVFNVFMTRTAPQQFKMVLKEVDPKGDDPIQQMYNHLEDALKENLVQWYFLHEEVPFAE